MQTESCCSHEQCFFENSDIPALDEEEKRSCEGLITLQETEQILKTFNRNRTPGNDGLPVEFYEHFWDDIKVCMLECFNYSYEQGKLSNSQRQGVITLLNKKGKDRLQLNNWRPISLLNVDYKILSKVISERIKMVMPKLVHINQTGFIADRHIGDAIRTLIDIVEHCDETQTEGLLMMVDFEKAFDSIEWSFIFKTLIRYNFGEMLLKWIRLFYSDIKACIINNSHTSPYFNISRGVRQGDPISPYLFVLCVEILSIHIRQNPDIK